MKFAFEVGLAEKNVVEYEFNQLLGSLVIKVNKQPVKRRLRLFNEPLKETHNFAVGQFEIANVRIEKERGALIVQKNKVFVDNRLAGVYQGV